MNDEKLVERLRTRVRSFQEIQIEASEQWSKNRIELTRCILEEDVNNFLNWKVLIGRVTFAPYSDSVDFLKSLPNWPTWEEALVRSEIGNPPLYPEYPKACGNLITQANHLATVLNASGREVGDYGFIYEVGGGFGNMCRLVYNLGFTGKYTVLDLPEMCALQEYYLSLTCPSQSIGFNALGDNISLFHDKSKFIQEAWKSSGRVLFLAMWSLSESPFDLRDEVFRVACGVSEDILIGYQDEWYGYDNVKYFQELTLNQKNFEWKDLPTPVFGNKLRYLIGRRK